MSAVDGGGWSHDNMSSVTSPMVDQYRIIMEDKADPRVNDWFLMSSPLPTIILCLGYLLVVRILGPLYMQNREPYNLKYPMLAYNLFQVLFNGWIFLGNYSSNITSGSQRTGIFGHHPALKHLLTFKY